MVQKGEGEMDVVCCMIFYSLSCSSGAYKKQNDVEAIQERNVKGCYIEM